MNIGGLLFLLFTQFLAGRGLLASFKIKERPVVMFAVSNICGIMICSLVPLFLEMLHIPITATSSAEGMFAISTLLFFPQWKKYDLTIFKKFRPAFPALYELLFILVFIYLMIPSLWRCFYYPPNARDILSGAETIAEYTVREHKIINSVFTVDLQSTNNHLKPPFVLDLQIMYKLLVHPFGQLWLSVVVINFLLWLYALLREKLHPVVTGLCMLLWICMPDPYGYTYIILYDYCNMVLFFSGVYYLLKYYERGRTNELMFSVLMFGFATFIRSETLLLVVMFTPLLFFFLNKKEHRINKKIFSVLLFIVVPAAFYYLWMGVFVKYYMPVHFEVSDNVVVSADRIPFFFKRLWDMNAYLFFQKINLQLFGYFMPAFALVLLADAILIRKYSNEAKILLYGILVVYIGMPLLGALIPWVDLSNTTKRGIYKMFPLMLLYFRNSPMLLKVSAAIREFEFPSKTAVVKQTVKQLKVSRKGKG